MIPHLYIPTTLTYENILQKLLLIKYTILLTARSTKQLNACFPFLRKGVSFKIVKNMTPIQTTLFLGLTMMFQIS